MDLTFFSLVMLSVVFVCATGGILFWAIFSGQYDNVDKQGYSILEDDDTYHDKESKS